jgi:alpha-L-fucosidase
MRTVLTALCALSLLAATAIGDPELNPIPAKAESLAAWQAARFGMFIHWGPVSLKGTEIGWSRGSQIPIAEYDNLYKQFNPTNFNPDEWVSAAKTAGMKYVVLTTKHHDGFCLWNTKQTDYNIMNSPFGRDVVKELADACRRQGLRFGTYYSVCDWHHPDFPRTSPGGSVKRPESNLDRYTDYLKQQVTELLTQYGPLFTLWFDVPQEFNAARGQSVINMARTLQPDIVINNRTGARGDYETPEQHIGGFNNTRPWETCMTICQQWAWKPNDNMKSLKQCLQTLVYCAGGDGNLLFNVGPMPTGEMEPRQVSRLKEMGEWMDRCGESIYGTRGGPFLPGTWGASTRKGQTVYLHVMKWPKTGLRLPPMDRQIKGSTVLTGGSAKLTSDTDGILVEVPEGDRQEIDTLVKLELNGSAMDLEARPVGGTSLALGKKATASNVFQNDPLYAPGKALDGDPGSRWATDAGTQAAWLEVDLGKPLQVGSISIEEAYAGRVQKFELQYGDGSRWQTALSGTTLGEGFATNLPSFTARYVRLNILSATDGPTINEFQLFKP